MNSRKSGNVIIENPSSNAPYLYKYFDLHRFIYFISQRQLFFTRLDKLEDPFEGLSTRFLRDNAHIKALEHELETAKTFSKERIEEIKNIKKLNQFVSKQTIQLSQNSQYVNCWFTCERESMAMWNLYSNKDSVALKIDFDDVKKHFQNPFQELVEENGNRLSVVGSEITYLKLNPFDSNLPKQKLKYSALKKDISFAYEKEYRFLIVTENLDEQPLFYTIKFPFENIKITVLTHPNMEEWKFKNIETLVKAMNLNLKIEKSSIILRPEMH